MKKLLNILLCLCLSIVYGNAQMLIVERERVKPKFETLNTDSIDLTSLKESDEKIYGMSLYELYRQYIGKRFIQYNSFRWAYVPERQFLDLPTPLTIDYLTRNSMGEDKFKGTFNISKIGTYVYDPTISKKGTVVYLNDLRGNSLNSFYTLKKDKFKRKYLFRLQLPDIYTKYSIRYLTLKDVIFVKDEEEFFNKLKEPADYEVLRDDTGERLYKSTINGKEYYSKKVKDDVGIYNDYEYVRLRNECVFIMTDDNNQEFFCSFDSRTLCSVDHLKYLKRKYVSRIYRDSYYDVVLKVLDIVFMEEDTDSGILELQYKMENVSSGEISYYSNSTFECLKEVIPDSYKTDNNGAISF